MHELRAFEKISIVYDVLISKEPYEYLIKKYRVKLLLITNLVNKAKKNKHFFKELREKEDENAKKIDMIEQRAQEFVDSNKPIFRAS